MAAKIYKSPYGNTWRVEERIGSTLYYTNHESLAEAELYCKGSNIKYTVENEILTLKTE